MRCYTTVSFIVVTQETVITMSQFTVWDKINMCDLIKCLHVATASVIGSIGRLMSQMSGEPLRKIARMMKIGTHNGTFHCDEVLACFMLKQLPQYKDAEIVR